MKLILIRSPQLLFYKMKTKKNYNDGYNYDLMQLQYQVAATGKLILKHICMKTVSSYYRKTP